MYERVTTLSLRALNFLFIIFVFQYSVVACFCLVFLCTFIAILFSTSSFFPAISCSLSGNYCGNASFLFSRLRSPQSRTFPFFTSLFVLLLSSIILLLCIAALFRSLRCFFFIFHFSFCSFHFSKIFIVFNSVNYDR